MDIFGKMFGRRHDNDPVMKVRTIMQRFIEASFLSIDSSVHNDPSKGLTVLLYMLGAVDMLCQVYDIDKKVSLDLFERLLMDELGEFSKEEARVILKSVLNATAEIKGKNIMREGAESLRSWLVGEDIAAPHRLTELLSQE